MDDKTIQNRLDRLFTAARERASAPPLDEIDYLLISRHAEGVSTADEEKQLAALCCDRPDVAELLHDLATVSADAHEWTRAPLLEPVFVAARGMAAFLRQPWGVAASVAAACLCLAALYFVCGHDGAVRPGNGQNNESAPLVFRGVHGSCAQTNEAAGATNAPVDDTVRNPGG